MNPEAKIQHAILCELYSSGRYLCLPIEFRNMSGCPDLMVLHEGEVIFLEVKTPKGRLSAIQKITFESFLRMGHRVFVVRSVAEAKDAVRGAFHGG